MVISALIFNLAVSLVTIVTALNVEDYLLDVKREAQHLADETCYHYLDQLERVLTSSELEMLRNESFPFVPSSVNHRILNNKSMLVQFLRRSHLNLTVLVSVCDNLNPSDVINITQLEQLVNGTRGIMTLMTQMYSAVMAGLTSAELRVDRELRLVDYRLYYSANEQLHYREEPEDDKAIRQTEWIVVRQLKEQMSQLVHTLPDRWF